MGDAKLSVRFAGPFVSFQDGGRPGHMRFGVPRSGPMDQLSFNAANAALGNNLNSTGIEVSMGGLVLECLEGAVTLAVTGGEFLCDHPRGKSLDWQVLSLFAGETLSLRAGPSGSWAYLAFSGDLQVSNWLGASATHSISNLGGGAIHTGHIITVQAAELREDRLGPVPRSDYKENQGVARVIMGPQDRFFPQVSLDAFTTESFALTTSFDRMGVRLSGPPLSLKDALSIPSEPVARGSIQVAGDGTPTILLADHQTTGGYPKIATIISADLDHVAQLRAGDRLRFEQVTAQEAVEIVREKASIAAKYLEKISISRGTLAQRLHRENLISGAVDARPDQA
ncbi:5-oxoprolinase subunit C family protein [Aliiroseovarius crassostreae]|uniref:5-oxoprolinase subunit C family protein n=1 Tax=Aliiroseovarius crassostreae TaxID=154981 RepID=UPI002205AE76|nr:biotin-dependent carboxyltransferase family protein [Aliiroseovarius crassostreae]UWQ06847.1 biotin-dependent carboxyltransferase family protein [Aliiroseovarius crassostreae]